MFDLELKSILSDYAIFLKSRYLEEIGYAYSENILSSQIPIMRIYAHMPKEEIHIKNIQSLKNLLSSMSANPETIDKNNLFEWELNQLPEDNKKDIKPIDLIKLYKSQRQALHRFVTDYTKNQKIIMQLIASLEEYYLEAQDKSLQLLLPLRLKAIETQIELERSNQELEKFAYFAAHDLQEPLRMVSQYVQLLGKRYKGKFDSDADEFIEYAVDGSQRMQSIIKSLLNLSRINSTVPSSDNDLNLVIDQVTKNLKKLIEENNAQVTHDSLPSLKVDESQMIQLFQNLIFNSIKYRSDRAPKIHIGLKKQQNNWLFSVSDNGIGIEKEDFERIFQLFQRVNGRDLHSGTGIGLTICKGVVERYGGRIWLESELDKGTTFYFTLAC